MNPITITPTEIRLHRLTYTVVIPKNSNITYNFNDRRNFRGTPLTLFLDSDSIKIESWCGVIGKTIYTISPFIMTWLGPRFSDKQSKRKAIIGIKPIKSFLDTLKTNGYDVAMAFDKFNEQVNLQIPPKFTLTDSSPKEKLAFLKYSSVGIVCFIFFITLLSVLTSTPLSEFFAILSFFIITFILGFLYTVISYLQWFFKNRGKRIE